MKIMVCRVSVIYSRFVARVEVGVSDGHRSFGETAETAYLGCSTGGR
jgi:hypothetical protein